MRHGHGVLTKEDGYKYEGKWNNGIQDGFGIEIDPAGFRYEGNYQKGKKRGKGNFLLILGSFQRK